MAIAFRVVVLLTISGAVYTKDISVGLDPSVVSSIVAPGVESEIAIVWVEPYVYAVGEKVGVDVTNGRIP